MEADEPPRLFSGRVLANLIKIALPSTLQQCFISVGNILIQSIINGSAPAPSRAMPPP